jgi:hypothetical protein
MDLIQDVNSNDMVLFSEEEEEHDNCAMVEEMLID